VLPCVLQLRTSYPCQGGLRRCHMSYDFGLRLSVEVGSDAATCPMTPDLTSRLRWAPVLPCVLWLRTLPPGQGGSRCCHASRGSQWVVCLRYIKKGFIGLPMQLGSRVFKARVHVLKAPDVRANISMQDVRTDIITCKTCRHGAIVQLNSAVSHDRPLTGTTDRECDPMGRRSTADRV
jgi:hypothetical protein